MTLSVKSHAVREETDKSPEHSLAGGQSETAGKGVRGPPEATEGLQQA